MSTPLLGTRYGTARDHHLVHDLHRRCAEETLRRRFHAPLPRRTDGLVAQLLEPPGGWSLLAVAPGPSGPLLVGMACVGSLSARELEMGLLVEDLFQGRGVGTRLLREVAVDAAGRGYQRLVCLTEPDNRAVLATAERSRLPFSRSWDDGLLVVTFDLGLLAAGRTARPA